MMSLSSINHMISMMSRLIPLAYLIYFLYHYTSYLYFQKSGFECIEKGDKILAIPNSKYQCFYCCSSYHTHHVPLFVLRQWVWFSAYYRLKDWQEIMSERLTKIVFYIVLKLYSNNICVVPQKIFFILFRFIFKPICKAGE